MSGEEEVREHEEEEEATTTTTTEVEVRVRQNRREREGIYLFSMRARGVHAERPTWTAGRLMRETTEGGLDSIDRDDREA